MPMQVITARTSQVLAKSCRRTPPLPKVRTWGGRRGDDGPGRDDGGGDHHEMMQGMMKMMMQMHGGMMGGGMNQMGAAGTMGGTGPMGMMDQDMMALMRGPMMGRFDADADGDGLISGEEAHGKLQSMHADADTNGGDGSLTLEEFEALHGEIIRSMMVDRFQHLDTDGDGLVTSGEMTAPADRMGMRPPIQGMMGDKMGTQDN